METFEHLKNKSFFYMSSLSPFTMLHTELTSAKASRIQVAPRRRRQCKTDYGARRKLVKTPKNKYTVVKYRLVVRQTCSKVIVQFISTNLDGDKVLAQANSTELSRYGIKTGLKNQAAHYACGLLAGRRFLAHFGVQDSFTANDTFKGPNEQMTDRASLEAVLDIGIITVTRGRKVFSAMKGALDAGVNVPHSEHNYPGYDETKTCVDPEAHYNRITGKHIAEYMAAMKEENPTKYATHFADYVSAGVTAENIEKMYLDAFKMILADPSVVRTARRTDVTHTFKNGVMTHSDGAKYAYQIRLSREERKVRCAAKLQQLSAIKAKRI